MTSTFARVLRDFIINGHPTRPDAQARIDYGVAQRQLTVEEAGELIGMLEDNTVLVDMRAAIEALAERVAAVEDKLRDPALPDDVKDWVPPSGAHDAYGIGDKVRYGGVIYVSKIAGNATVPGSDERWWEVYVG